MTATVQWRSLNEQKIQRGLAEKSRLGKTDIIYYKYSYIHSESNADSVKILAELSQMLVLFLDVVLNNFWS